MMELPPHFFEVHSNMPRQGPGCNECTRKAYGMIEAPPNPRILDVGCGPGQQTIELAKISGGKIVALDFFEIFLNELKANVEAAGVADKVEVVQGDMNKMEFDDESFDVIWCEGAMFVMGIEKALAAWKKFLKPDGYLCFTELCWIKENPPEEVKKFFDNAYPQITDVAGNLKYIENTGYELVGHFTLGKKAWLEGYFKPIEEKLPGLKEKHKGDEKAEEYLAMEELEIATYRKYSDWYGYEFFVTRSSK